MTSIIRRSDLTWFMVDTVEQGEKLSRVILQVDNIPDLIYLSKQETDMTIKAVYIVLTHNLAGSDDWEMNKVSTIWTAMDSRYKHTIYLYSQAIDDSRYYALDSLAGLKKKHIINIRTLCTFPSGDK